MILIAHDKLFNLINVRLHCRLFWRRLKTRNQILNGAVGAGVNMVSNGGAISYEVDGMSMDDERY